MSLGEFGSFSSTQIDRESDLMREIERLRAAAAEVIEAWTREDDSITDAIVRLGQILNADSH